MRSWRGRTSWQGFPDRLYNPRIVPRHRAPAPPKMSYELDRSKPLKTYVTTDGIIKDRVIGEVQAFTARAGMLAAKNLYGISKSSLIGGFYHIRLKK